MVSKTTENCGKNLNSRTLINYFVEPLGRGLGQISTRFIRYRDGNFYSVYFTKQSNWIINDHRFFESWQTFSVDNKFVQVHCSNQNYSQLNLLNSVASMWKKKFKRANSIKAILILTRHVMCENKLKKYHRSRVLFHYLVDSFSWL